jgi:TPR repeat protein
MRKAAKQGHAGAQYDLGICYEDGYGVGKNKRKAVEWMRKSAEQGEEKAKEWLEENGQK